jgi:Ca-activated chloride channel family protein
MTTPHTLRRRELERELRQLPAPPPPADLLAKLRAEIPADLTAANADAPLPAPRNGAVWLRLAASLAIVAVGLTIASQIVRERGLEPAKDERPSSKGKTEVGSGVAVEAPSPSIEATQRGVEPDSRQAAATPFTPPAADEPRRPSPRAVTREAGADIAGAPMPRTATVASIVDRINIDEEPKTATPAEDATFHGSARYQVAEPATGAAAPAPPPAPAPAGAAPLQSPPSMEASAATPRGAAPRAQSARAAEQVEKEVGKSADLRALGYLGRADVERDVAMRDAGAAVDSMHFRDAGTSPIVDTAEDRLSTFALDVDTGSWTLTREYLGRDLLPPAAAVRTEEFVNAQRYDDPAPRRGELTLVAEGAPSPFAPGDDWRLLRFAVKGRELAARARRPANLTFVVDVSGSMNRENRLGLVQRSLGLLLDELGPDDRLALVVYGTRGRVLLRPTRDREAIREAIDALRPEGATNAEEGLRLGYEIAGEMYRASATNRVILCSDGVANVGADGPEPILARIGEAARRGIELTTVGFGMGNYNDGLMEQLADQGDGRYHYVDSLDEARRIFVDELTGTLETIAKDAKAQVEFDPAVVERWRLLGYDNREVADRDFRNDRVDAGELGAGHAATALYEVRLAPGVRAGDRVATLRLRWQSVASGEVEEAALALHVRDLERSFDAASLNLRKAALAAELAERLKATRHADGSSWPALDHEARRLSRSASGDASLAELVAAIVRATRLADSGRYDLRGPAPDDER